MRWATLVLLTLLGCNDLREFRGVWRGSQVGGADVLRLGIGQTPARLSIDAITTHGLMARLAIGDFLPETAITSVAGAEADVLAGLTFGGSPLRVYLAFVPMPDGGGAAVAVIALYDDRRVELRLLRGGTPELYGIFALTASAQ